MKYGLSQIFLLIVILLFFFKCANIGQPTGGPKDIEPPVLLSTYPKDQTVNFKDNKIIFTFSEPIKVDDVKKQIIITPPIEEENYNLKIKNNVLTFQLKEGLVENSTYTLNLGEAVKDITESNKATNIKIGFSTGSYIDSLKISGNVSQLMQNNPAINAVVGVYNANDTLNLFNKRPLYLTKTDSAGNFELTNLKNSPYRIYSFIDKNDNLKNDPLTEAFGFKADVIDLTSSIKDVNIKLFRQDNRDLKLQSSRPDGQYFLIKFNKFVKDYILSPTQSKIKLSHNLVDANTTIRVYNTFTQDSLKASLIAYDTLDKQISEEVTIKFITSKKPPEPFNVTISPNENDRIPENFKSEITFSKPVKHIIADSMFFSYDSLNILPINPDTDLKWNKNMDKVVLEKTLNKNLAKTQTSTEAAPKSSGRNLIPKSGNDGGVQLYVSKGSFISIENDSNAVIDKKYKFINPQEVGVIEGNAFTDHQSFAIQLLDKNYKVISEIKDKKSYRFENVKPGEYRIRVLVDNNGDGTWTPGDINELREPEDVVLLDELITIRANWERKDVNISF